MRSIVLGPGEVHVWRIVLNSQVGRAEYCSELLCDRERARAKKYLFQKDRDRFVIARGVLRRILGSYLGLAPRRVPIRYGPWGKPMIDVAEGIPPFHFNLAHAHDLAVIAVARDGRVGIDLEFVRADFEWMTVARRFFSPRELAGILAVPTRKQAEAFFAGWTRKEACLKAIGCGLAGGLEGIELSTGHGRQAVLVAVPREMSPVSRWKLIDLTPGYGYKACMVVEGDVAHVRQWDWPGELLGDRPAWLESSKPSADPIGTGRSAEKGAVASDG